MRSVQHHNCYKTMTVNLRGKMPASKRAHHLKRSRSYLQRTKRHNKKATMSMLLNKCSRLRKSGNELIT